MDPEGMGCWEVAREGGTRERRPPCLHLGGAIWCVQCCVRRRCLELLAHFSGPRGEKAGSPLWAQRGPGFLSTLCDLGGDGIGTAPLTGGAGFLDSGAI